MFFKLMTVMRRLFVHNEFSTRSMNFTQLHQLKGGWGSATSFPNGFHKNNLFCKLYWSRFNSKVYWILGSESESWFMF